MDRLKQYEELLKDRKEYLYAIEEAEKEQTFEQDTRLYLRTMAPVLTEFAGWVLEQAVSAGKKRLYFLSRDGFQMYLAAKQISEKRALPVECRYLYVSRYALRVPVYHLDPENCLDLICVGGIDVTLEKILRRGGLTPEETADIIVSAGWQNKYGETLNYRQILALKQTLKKQPRLMAYMDKHSREKYVNAIGYLRQEGLLTDGDYAVVDSGWVGTCQQTLERLIHSVNPGIRVEGYYFGLYELPAGADPSLYHSWYFSPTGGLRRKAHFSNSLFETICSAEEGMTVEYLFRSGRFVPRTVRTGNPNRDQIERNIAALRKFLEQPETGKRNGRIPAERLFELLMARPGQLEVCAYGDSLFSDDLLEGGYQETAAKLTGKQIRDQRFLKRLLIAAGLRRGKIRESAWIEGSIVRKGGRTCRISLWHAKNCKYILYARKQLANIRTIRTARREA